MTSVKTSLLFIIALLFVSGLSAQELTRALEYNAVQHYRSKKPFSSYANVRAELPFVDDFSRGNSPDESKWIGSQVYINNTCPINPPTIGVATFDGLNSDGLPYDSTGNNITPRSADTLTSVKIDLSGLSSANNVYFSFLYQPQGLCDYPNLGDSLVLEFSGDTVNWIKQWSINGFNASPNPTEFTWVIFQVSDPIFFTDKFQFRFRNKAVITGNNDHWHVDYVQLDKDRSPDDTNLNDIAIQYPSPSLLRHYSEMPWNQFQANAAGETALQTKIFSRNNYTTDKNTTYGYTSQEVYSGTPLNNPPVAAFNFTALSNETIELSPIEINTFVAESALFRTTYFTSLTGSPDELSANDTLIQYQRFSNYFAYDDGSAEKAIYLLGLTAQSALGFHVNTQDTLQGVSVQWARILGTQASLLFSVQVWKSLATNELLYQQDFLNPEYIDSVNGFSTYVFDSGVVVTDSFYVGFMQSQNQGMDIGFDKNTDSHNNLKINLGNGWITSSTQGSWMIRPIVGGRDGLYNTGVAGARDAQWNSYPNPVTDWVQVSGAPNESRYQLIDAVGRTVASGLIYNERIDLPAMSQGFYLLQVSSTKSSKTFRIVKQ